MIKAFFDGSCEPVNPGGTAAYGAIVYRGSEVLHSSSGIYAPEIPGYTSNNLAEYLGFLAVITFLKESMLDQEKTAIYGDSKLVVEQMSGNWRIKSGLYTIHAIKARALLDTFKIKPTIKWIPRDRNSVADALSKAHLKAG